MTLRTLELNGAEVTVNDTGAGDPVMLLHGLLGDHRTWRRQVESFAPRCRVLALSPRYYLPNRWPDDGTGFGMASHAADVVALVQEWGLPPVHLLGHSYGGGVAALVAMQHPALVRTLILAEPALGSLAMAHPEMPGLAADFAASRQQAYADWTDGHHAKAVEDHLRYVFGADGLERVRSEHYTIIAENGCVIVAAYRPRPVPPAVTREQIQAIRVPTLVIEGSASRPLFRLTCAALAECLPFAERVTLDGVSHALAMEAPEAFNAAVLKFLAEASEPWTLSTRAPPPRAPLPATAQLPTLDSRWNPEPVGHPRNRCPPS